ncbi:uncharacterized protein LOC130678189 [Microplitis mediator]|uniref:uncharacterized protein LOC130678189 n=1 Tax=Microplitis mediator TaxID=375433 RepID=UPI002552A0F5|nr:uncharacterized protein LOC130678189 [Microplitis mediator]
MGRRETININFEIRQDSIDKSIKSLMRFVDSVKSEIDKFRKEFENVYNEYLTSVEKNQMKLSISYSSFRKADGIYSKIISALKKFIALLMTDYADILLVANKLTTANKKFFKIQQQIIDNKRNDLSQLEQSIKNMKNIIKNFNELANEYHSKMMVFQSLQRNLQDRMIVYTSFNGNQFRLLIKSELEEFRDLLELDDSSSLRGKINSLFITKSARQLKSIGDENLLHPIKSLKIIDSTENDNTEDQQSTGPPRQVDSRDSKRKRPSDDDPPALKKLKMTKLFTSIMSITADNLKSQNVINFDYFSNDEINNSLAKGKELWRNWVDISFNDFVNREGFNDFIDYYSYLLPITNNSSDKIQVINKIFYDVIEMERKFVESRNDVELLDILNLEPTDPEEIEEQYKYLRKKVIIHELNYYYIYYLIGNLYDERVIKDGVHKIDEIESLKSEICEYKIVSFMEGQLLRKIEKALTENILFKSNEHESLRYKHKDHLNKVHSSIVNTKIDISMILFDIRKNIVSPNERQIWKLRRVFKKKELDRLIELEVNLRTAYYSRYLEKNS